MPRKTFSSFQLITLISSLTYSRALSLSLASEQSTNDPDKCTRHCIIATSTDNEKSLFIDVKIRFDLPRSKKFFRLQNKTFRWCFSASVCQNRFKQENRFVWAKSGRKVFVLENFRSALRVTCCRLTEWMSTSWNFYLSPAERASKFIIVTDDRLGISPIKANHGCRCHVNGYHLSAFHRPFLFACLVTRGILCVTHETSKKRFMLDVEIDYKRNYLIWGKKFIWKKLTLPKISSINLHRFPYLRIFINLF